MIDVDTLVHPSAGWAKPTVAWEMKWSHHRKPPARVFLQLVLSHPTCPLQLIHNAVLLLQMSLTAACAAGTVTTDFALVADAGVGGGEAGADGVDAGADGVGVDAGAGGVDVGVQTGDYKWWHDVDSVAVVVVAVVVVAAAAAVAVVVADVVGGDASDGTAGVDNVLVLLVGGVLLAVADAGDDADVADVLSSSSQRWLPQKHLSIAAWHGVGGDVDWYQCLSSRHMAADAELDAGDDGVVAGGGGGDDDG